ncbi:DNA-binding transcriptional regulator, AcrR family [Rhodococcus triatomae]|uniref:DNA-binding transcriptional regulator, AcrR family n=1 Tax=Rhodococcus triatomae TaxID=300028 RepID=A0A1G8JRQ8_9NOCA|nr:DNA-binding transcriptional regulator, AcrR family [Rhodococcus triatomae]
MARTGTEKAAAGATATESGETAAKAVRRRPKNRKAQIAAVAATAFSERGYHAVGVDEIAAELGISGPALYRHFPNKYALLVHAATSAADGLRTASAEALADASSDPRDRLERILTALIANTIDNRRVGGIYRWEGRYLEPTDRRRLREAFATVTEQVAAPIRQLRPQLSAEDATTLAAGALSVVGSITAHRTALSSRRTTSLILDACSAVVDTDLPPVEDSPKEPTPRGLPVTSKRELLIAEAVKIFDRQGYHESSIEEIGAAAGINASSVYRHFPSKADLLAAVFYRASDRLAAATAHALGSSSDRAEALEKLVDSYVELSFRTPAVLSVYFAEIGNLPQHERTNLRNIQRLHVEEWVSLVTAIRPDLSPPEARFLVHAALGLVLDVGRLVRFDVRQPDRLTAMMRAVLFEG